MKVLIALIICVVVVGGGYLFMQKNNMTPHTRSESHSGDVARESGSLSAESHHAKNRESTSLVNGSKGKVEDDLGTVVEYDSAGDPINDDLPEVSQELEDRYSSVLQNPSYPTLASRLSEMNARRHGSETFSPEEVMDAIEQEEPWQVRSEPGANLSKLSAEQINDGREFIDFNKVKVESLMPGDKMTISIGELGQSFDIEVSRVKIFDDGNITWQGNILGEEVGRVSITQSDKVSVGSVVLAQTDYTIESHGSDGWLVNSATLFNIEDPNTPDYVIPEEEAHLHK